MIIYTRAADGSIPIKVIEMPVKGRAGKFEMLDHQLNPVREYLSARKLVGDLTRGKMKSFDRYFGHINKREVVDVPVTELFKGLAPANRLGIDLGVKYSDVRKILYAHFRSRIVRSGFDMDDVLQEVYRGILTRNLGRCPFNVQKSSFGHYVYLVTECLLNNYHRKENRRRDMEQVGMSAPPYLQVDGGATTVDAALVARDVGGNDDVGEDVLATLRRVERVIERQRKQGKDIDKRASAVAGFLITGHTKKDIAHKMKLSPARVNRIIDMLKESLS